MSNKELTDYVFEDKDIDSSETGLEDDLIVLTSTDGEEFHFYRGDVVFMAKHFKLTEDDLK